MKLNYLFFIGLLTAPGLLPAQTGSKPAESGWDSEAAINVIYTRERSRLNTEDDRIYADYTSRSAWQSDALIAPLATFNYTFQDLGTQFFLGTAREDVAQGQFHTQVGMRYWLGNGSTLSLGLIPGLVEGEVWADPFLLNSRRVETDESIRALRLQYNNIVGSDFSVELAVGEVEVDDESSGASVAGLSIADRQRLNRNANIYYLQGEHNTGLGPKALLKSAVSWTRLDAEGEAMAFDRLALKLSVFRFFARSRLSLNAEFSQSDYDALNPIFQSRRKDDEYSVFLAYEYERFYNWQNTSLITFAGWNQVESNIVFYDEQGFFTAVGLNYKF